MNTRMAQDVLGLPLAELRRAGVAAPPLPGNVAVAVRALDDGMAAIEMQGALVCVIISPAAWQRLQATNTAWCKLFRWAVGHIDTATLRRMTASAEHVLNGRPGRGAPCRQP
jgi:hypothetical protein